MTHLLASAKPLNLVLCFTVAAAAAACSSGSGSPGDRGGSGGTGGSGASGGTNSATGGSGGSGGTPSTAEMLFSFDDDIDGWALEPEPGSGAGGAGGEGGALPTGPDLTPFSTIEHDPDAGEPEPGSLMFTVPFSDYQQGATFQYNFDTEQDWSGKTLSLVIRFEEGGFTPNPSFPGGLILFVKTGDDWTWMQRAWQNLGSDVAGRWLLVEYDLDNPDTVASIEGYDAARVKSIGLKVDTGGGSTDATEDDMPTEAVFHVDSITLE